MVSSEREDVIQSLEEEVKAQLTEANCKKQFVEQVVKMTGENEGDIEKEYDEDYKKFTPLLKRKGILVGGQLTSMLRFQTRSFRQLIFATWL